MALPTMTLRSPSSSSRTRSSREEMPPLKVILLEEDLRPYFPDKRTTVPDAKQGIFEALKLRQMAKERQEQQAKATKKDLKKQNAVPR